MARAQRTWIAALARLGFAVKGILYLLLGGLALRFATSGGGALTDPHGAVVALLQRPYGRPLVAFLAAGLAFYAAWRFLEAFADANNKGTDRDGLTSRAVYALSGSVYGLLAYDAARLALASGGAGGVELPATMTGSPLARGMAMFIAVGLFAYGASQLWAAFSTSLSDQLSHGQVEHDAGRWPVRVSRVGIAGRAVVLMLMAVVLLRRATISASAAARTDTGDSLRLIAALPTGDWLLAGVAAGLIAYGVFNLVMARYRRITPP
jgi:hypothetical protein